MVPNYYFALALNSAIIGPWSSSSERSAWVSLHDECKLKEWTSWRGFSYDGKRHKPVSEIQLNIEKVTNEMTFVG
jgi:hypothetical protein